MLAKSLQIITGLFATALRSFAMVVAILQLAWGSVLAFLCFWIAGQGSMIRGTLAAGLALLLVLICAVIIALYFSALAVVRKAVADVGLGKRIFDALFAYALGISGEDSGEPTETARIPTHLSRAEVEQKLNEAAKYILAEEGPKFKLLSPIHWLSKQIQRISIWATVRVIVKSCSNDGTAVNMFHLRDRLASSIDQHLLQYVKGHFTKLAFSVISVVSLLMLLLALGISYLPL